MDFFKYKRQNNSFAFYYLYFWINQYGKCLIKVCNTFKHLPVAQAYYFIFSKHIFLSLYTGSVYSNTPSYLYHKTYQYQGHA